VWRILRGLGWSVQRPVRVAAERDKQAIARWVAEDWPAIKQTVSVWACGPGGSLSGSGAGIAA
jgi:Winged helix-turn helix